MTFCWYYIAGIAIAATAAGMGSVAVHLAGGSGYYGFVVMPHGIHFVSNVAVTAVAGVGGIAVLFTGRSGHNCRMIVARCRDHFLLAFAAALAGTGLVAVLGAGSRQSHIPSGPVVTEGGNIGLRHNYGFTCITVAAFGLAGGGTGFCNGRICNNIGVIGRIHGNLDIAQCLVAVFVTVELALTLFAVANPVLAYAFLRTGCGNSVNMDGVVGMRKNCDRRVFVAGSITVFTLLMLPAGSKIGSFQIGDPLESVVCQGQDLAFGIGGGCFVRFQIKLAVGAVEIRIVTLLGAGGCNCGGFRSVGVRAGNTDVAGSGYGLRFFRYGVNGNRDGNGIDGHAVVLCGHLKCQLQNGAVQIRHSIHRPQSAVSADVIQGAVFQEPLAGFDHRGKSFPGNADGGRIHKAGKGNGQVNGFAPFTGGTADRSSALGKVSGYGEGHQNQTEDDGHSSHK